MIDFKAAIKNKAVWLAFALGVVVGLGIRAIGAPAFAEELREPCSIQISAADVLHTPATLLSRCE